jgi:hypothetical protein
MKRVIGSLIAIILGAVLFVWAFSLLPVEDSRVAIDWKLFWQATRGFGAEYSIAQIYTPPWALPPIWLLTASRYPQVGRWSRLLH